MEYKKCKLYGLKSKKKLFELLSIENKRFSKQSFIVCQINPHIINGVRLVEAPSSKLKYYQNKIFNYLKLLEIPDNIFCGLKGRCYLDNVKKHIENDNMFKVDISKFYPSISRDKVYKFFFNKLNMSPDVAQIITNFATINLDLKKQNTKNMQEVNDFLTKKQILCKNHLATGTPFGSLLSYLVNVDMYDELQEYANKNNLTMTAYIDDVAFSTNNKISGIIRKQILSIIKKHHYICNKKKCKFYGKKFPKRLTGGVITEKKHIEAQNKLIYKAKQISKMLKQNYEFNKKEIQQAQGVISAIEMTERKMPQLKLKLKEKRKILNN